MDLQNDSAAADLPAQLRSTVPRWCELALRQRTRTRFDHPPGRGQKAAS